MMTRNPFSAPISGVLYAEDFGDALSKPAPAELKAQPAPKPVVVAPSFSLEDMQAAVEQANKEGRETERLASAQSQETLNNNLLAMIVEQLRLAHEECGQIVERSMSVIAQTTLSLLSTALPGLCAQRASTDLAAIMQRLRPAVRQMLELQVCVNPKLRQVIEKEMTMILERSETHVTWIESENMPAADIAISWQNGAAVRDTKALCANIHDAVVALLDDAPRTEAGDV